MRLTLPTHEHSVPGHSLYHFIDEERIWSCWGHANKWQLNLISRWKHKPPEDRDVLPVESSALREVPSIQEVHHKYLFNKCLWNLYPQPLLPWFPLWLLILSLILTCGFCLLIQWLALHLAYYSSLRKFSVSLGFMWSSFSTCPYPVLPFTSATSWNPFLKLRLSSVTQDFPAHQNTKEMAYFL